MAVSPIHTATVWVAAEINRPRMGSARVRSTSSYLVRNSDSISDTRKSQSRPPTASEMSVADWCQHVAVHIAAALYEDDGDGLADGLRLGPHLDLAGAGRRDARIPGPSVGHDATEGNHVHRNPKRRDRKYPDV